MSETKVRFEICIDRPFLFKVTAYISERRVRMCTPRGPSVYRISYNFLLRTVIPLTSPRSSVLSVTLLQFPTPMFTRSSRFRFQRLPILTFLFASSTYSSITCLGNISLSIYSTSPCILLRHYF